MALGDWATWFWDGSCKAGDSLGLGKFDDFLSLLILGWWVHKGEESLVE